MQQHWFTLVQDVAPIYSCFQFPTSFNCNFETSAALRLLAAQSLVSIVRFQAKLPTIQPSSIARNTSGSEFIWQYYDVSFSEVANLQSFLHVCLFQDLLVSLNELCVHEASAELSGSVPNDSLSLQHSIITLLGLIASLAASWVINHQSSFINIFTALQVGCLILRPDFSMDPSDLPTACVFWFLVVT